MKIKILAIAMVAALMLTFLCSCNMQLLDTTYKFDYAYISLPNGKVVEGPIDSWCDYESDAVQVVINGKTYVTHYSNVVMVAD